MSDAEKKCKLEQRPPKSTDIDSLDFPILFDRSVKDDADEGFG